MSGSNCASTASDRQQKSCCNIHCNTHRSQSCHSVYDPRLHNERPRHHDSCYNLKKSLDPPVEICDLNTTNIDLPPLTWVGYDCAPKLLTLRNTGRTVLLNGQWSRGRPYVTGGPLNGTYIFSQIHFHCPSEHEINGVRYPLEMHVVHYKTSYLTQERAMYEKDGTIVFVYLFQVADVASNKLFQITSYAQCVCEENSSVDLPRIALNQFVTPFKSNYYLYSGSVNTEKNSYLLQWFVLRSILRVTCHEVNNLKKILESCKSPSKITRMKPENGDVFCVEEYDSFCEVTKSHSSCGHAGEHVHKEPVKKSKSQTSSKSIHFQSPSVVCQDEDIQKDDSGSCKSEKKVVIITTDGCTNTSPIPSRNDCTVQKSLSNECSKSSEIMVCEKIGVCDSNNTTDETKSILKEKTKGEKSSKKEKAPKPKKEKEVKIKESKEKGKKDEKAAKATTSSENTDDNIKTIYEKKQSPKPKKEKKEKSKAKHDKAAENKEDVQVNYLLTPSIIESNYSNIVASEESRTSDVKEEINDKESKNCFSIPTQILVKRCSLSAVNLPSVNDEVTPKELCLFMDHFFRSDQKDDKPQSWNFQQYHVAIEYDHNILQEYNGMPSENEVTMGMYEKLSVVPKYEDINDLKIALTDYFIKLESSEEIQIRAKFSVKENLTANNSIREKRTREFKKSLDAETQCKSQELDFEFLESSLMNDLIQKSKTQEFTKVLDAETQCKSQELVSDFLQNILSGDLKIEKYISSQNSRISNQKSDQIVKITRKMNELRDELHRTLHDELHMELHDKLRDELHRELTRKSLNQEYNFQIKSDNLGSEGEAKRVVQGKEDPFKKKWINRGIKKRQLMTADDNSEALIEINRSVSKCLRPDDNQSGLIDSSKDPLRMDKEKVHFIRNNKQLSSAANKTTYFVYDKIEKDLVTGKKVFVGSFRSKDEIKYFQKNNSTPNLEDLIESSDSLRDEKEKGKEEKSISINEIEIKDSELLRIEKWCNKQLGHKSLENSVPGETKSGESTSKEVVSLHKCQRRNFDQGKNRQKGNVKGFLVGKLIGQENDEESFKRKTSNSPNLNRDKEEVGNSSANATPTSSDCNRKLVKSILDKCLNNVQEKFISQESEELLNTEYYEKKKESEEEDALSCTKSKISSGSTKSRGTVIVIPLEVESFSKIELILVEHTEDVKRKKPENEYIPCLNFYK